MMEELHFILETKMSKIHKHVYGKKIPDGSFYLIPDHHNL